MALSSPIYDSIMAQTKQEANPNYIGMASQFLNNSRAALDVFRSETDTKPKGLADTVVEGSSDIPDLPGSNSKILEAAKSLGNPKYSLEKRGQPGYEDCSSGACKVMKKAFNKDVGQTTLEMRKKGTWINNPRTGDLVHFDTGKDERHVGIMIGKDKFWHQSVSGPKISTVSGYGFKPVGYTRY